jgi:hypothetical protein
MKETHVITLAHFELGDCSLLGWIALQVSFSECPRSSKSEFKAKSYGRFNEHPVLTGCPKK